MDLKKKKNVIFFIGHRVYVIYWFYIIGYRNIDMNSLALNVCVT